MATAQAAIAFAAAASAAPALTGTALAAKPIRPQLSFEPNQGQAPEGADFVVRAGTRTLLLSARGMEVASPAGVPLRIELAGSDAGAAAEALDRRPGASHYLLADRWTTGVPHYGKVRYRSVYAGVDLVYYFNGEELEHDFVVEAGRAAWQQIRLRVDGARRLRLDGNGDLLIETAAGVVRQKKPVVYQKNRRVEGRYRVAGREFGFEIGAHDPGEALVIDPVTVFGTYLGGAGTEQPNAIAADAQGNTYVAGATTSANFPVRGGVQGRYGGNTDVFVTKLDGNGAIVYSTYVGGGAVDSPAAIRVDSTGSVYLAGSTRSADFPAPRGLQTRLAGALSAFVLKLNAAGNALVYSTYLNGPSGAGNSVARGLDIDAQGNAYIVGATTANDFPVRGTNFGRFFRAGIDGFVSKLNADGTALVYSGYFAGSGADYLEGVSVNSIGEAVVVGWSTSPDLPTDNADSRWPRPTGTTSGYFAKIAASGAQLTSSTYYGGTRNDYLLNVHPDRTDPAVVYVVGLATSPDFPTVTGLPVRVGTTGAIPFAAKFAMPGLSDLATAPAPLAPGRTGGPENKPNDRYDWFIPVENECRGGDFQPLMDQLKTDQEDLRNIREATFASGVTFIAGPTAGLATAGLVVANRLACPARRDKERAAAAGSWLFGINLATAREYEVPQPPDSVNATLRAVASDNAGHIYAAMQTTDRGLPVTAGGAAAASSNRTGYVTRISPDAGTGGGGAGSSGPSIRGVVNAFGGSTTLAPNTWVVITGTNLAPATSQRIWQGSDFVNNQLPVTLDGTSVRLNGQNAYVWYVSPTQLNILTPPTLAAGPVQVTVTAGGATSAAFAAQAQPISLALFVFGAGPYATAIHANGSLLGPTTLYPGLSTPAEPGESIILYGNGFGPTSVPVVAGATSQSGTLSPLPLVQIGGVNATVQFAGLVAPGLYQLNVQVPSSLPTGDHAVVVQHAGASTQRGVLLTVQR